MLYSLLIPLCLNSLRNMHSLFYYKMQQIQQLPVSGAQSLGDVSTGLSEQSLGDVITGLSEQSLGDVSTGLSEQSLGDVSTGLSEQSLGEVSTGLSEQSLGDVSTGLSEQSQGFSRGLPCRSRASLFPLCCSNSLSCMDEYLATDSGG